MLFKGYALIATTKGSRIHNLFWSRCRCCHDIVLLKPYDVLSRPKYLRKYVVKKCYSSVNVLFYVITIIFQFAFLFCRWKVEHNLEKSTLEKHLLRSWNKISYLRIHYATLCPSNECSKIWTKFVKLSYELSVSCLTRDEMRLFNGIKWGPGKGYLP